MAETLLACPLCGSPQLTEDTFAAKHLNLTAQYGVSHCASCTMRFLNPRPTKAEYEQLYATGGGNLGELYPGINDFYAAEISKRQYRFDQIVSTLVDHQAGNRLLEIGASTGEFLSKAKAAGFSVEGVEPSKKACEAAEARHGLTLTNTSIEEANFNHASFDVIVASHVFEHLLDPLKVIRRVESWLKIGGLCLVEIPNQFTNSYMLKSRLTRKCPVRPRSVSCIHHTMFYSRNSLIALAHQARLAVRHVRSVDRNTTTFWRFKTRAKRLFWRLTCTGPQLELLAFRRPAKRGKNL